MPDLDRIAALLASGPDRKLVDVKFFLGREIDDVSADDIAQQLLSMIKAAEETTPVSRLPEEPVTPISKL